jgi:hypothetical protein
MHSTENIWDTFWGIAAAVSGLGLPGAIVLLLICYFVVFLRWICRDSSFVEAWRATKPGRRLWVKVISGTGLALFLLVLPLCSLDLIGYGLLVASVVCVVSIFSKSLHDATRLSHWAFWLIAAGLTSIFDFLIWSYCASGAGAAGLESYFPFIQLLLVGFGYFFYQRVPEFANDHPRGVALRLVFCVISLVMVDHASAQMSYFLSVRTGDLPRSERVLADSPYFSVSSAMQEMLRRSPPSQLAAKEEKVSRARVDFEEDLARVIAFFLGLAGFNAIVAVTSRQFGLRNAKSVPLVAKLNPAAAPVPEMPEPVRRSVFFPNRRYRLGHGAMLLTLALAGNLFVSFITIYSTTKGNLAHFTLSFLAYSGMLFPPILLGCKNGFRLAAYRSRSSLRAVHILMHTPSYQPLEVTVRAPTLLQRLQHRITGAWIRHAVGKDGKLYSVMFGHCPTGEFPAHLYQLRSGPLNESLTGRQAYVAIPRYDPQAQARVESA